MNLCFDCDFIVGLINQINSGVHGKIDNKKYSLDLQNLIDLLLKKNYNERPNINKIYELIMKYKDKNNKQIKKKDIGLHLTNSDKKLNKDVQKKEFRTDFKIILIGNNGTNKSSFVDRWTKNIFSDTYKATIVSDFGIKIFEYDGKIYRIQLWDLVGQDKNDMVTKIFAKDADGGIIMSDARNIQTREDTIKWKKNVDEAVIFLDGGNIPIILVENNIELLENKEENASTLNEFCVENGFIGGFRVSSKTGENVNESMEYLIINIIKRLEIAEKNGLYIFNTERSSVLSDINKNNRCFLF